MINYAKRVLQAMPVKSDLVKKELEVFASEEEVNRYLVAHKFYGILIKLHDVAEMNAIVDKFEDSSGTPDENYEYQQILLDRGDPAEELGMLEKDDTSALYRRLFDSCSLF